MQPLSPAVSRGNTNSPRDSSVSCPPRILAVVTIGGRRLFHSELLIVWLLLEGGDYASAVSNRRSTVHTYG